MKESAPERGAGSDDSHRGKGSVAGIARWEHLGGWCVRTGSSNADAIEDCPLSDGSFSISSLASSSRSQRSRGLDSAERPPEGGSEARGSGKSERSERNDAGRSLSLSAGWRAVAAACHAGEGAGHE